MRHSWILTLSVFGLAVLAHGQAQIADEAIENLNGKPNSPELLALVKAAIPSVSNVTDKCRLGAVYVLGCLATGQTAEGLAVRAQLLKAYPTDPACAELADKRIMTACKACASGVVQSLCPVCKGEGNCGKCFGTGKQTVTGLGGDRTIRCMHCGGDGKCKKCQGAKTIPQPCPSCAGRGLVPAPAMVTAAYLRLLASAGQPATGGMSPDVGLVEQAIKNALDQAAHSTLLTQYAVTAADIQRLAVPDLAPAQREKAAKAMLPRGYQEQRSDNKNRLFFLPFPAGLTYRVKAVARSGDTLRLSLTSSPANDPAVDGVMTSVPILTQIEAGLCEPLRGFLRDPVVVVPARHTDVLSLSVNQIVTSGSWILPVAFTLEPPRFKAEPLVYRSGSELFELRGISP